VTAGDLVEVDLGATGTRPWAITSEGTSLRREPGAGPPPVFEAVTAGTASIRGARRACSTAGTSGAACGAIQAYAVTVVVR
jgi:hypothetical protein